ncbi:heavy metal-binding domain-containing protein [bacterium]|nr:heavy metal-binding domain-containing protein [bacterium]
MDNDTIGTIIGLGITIGIPLSMLFITYFIGSTLEKNHYKSILEREKKFINLPAVSGKNFIDPEKSVKSANLVSGVTIVSIDYFKRFLGGLKNLVGGEVVAYESVLDRARRESILRMKEKSPNADIIINLKIETSTIGKVTNKGGTGCSEVIAYGTAITYDN